MRFTGFGLSVLFAAAAFGQSIMTPLFVHKDGDATPAVYGGSEKDLFVDGASPQSVGWITFQTQGLDVSRVTSARLVLYVANVTGPGTLQARELTTAITAPENNVRFTAINTSTAVAASQALGTADIEKVVQLDLTDAVCSGSFRGIALMSDDGLAASFDSKEGRLAPVILLRYDVDSVAAAWLTGSGIPSASSGKSGDLYLDTGTGDVYVKESAVWTIAANIKGAAGPAGPQGSTGNTGPDGPRGEKGDKGDAGTPGTIGPTFTDLHDSLELLRTEINSLKTLLAHFSRVGNEIYITGANLNIRNGMDSTTSTNGLGNVVVGYNENVVNATRTGSHNIVNGIDNEYTSYSGRIGGDRNTISGPYAIVLAGQNSLASGKHSFVATGGSHLASGDQSCINGGTGDTVLGDFSATIGGIRNVVSNTYAVCVAGWQNQVTGQAACAISGKNDTASGQFSSVTGGYQNLASSQYGHVSGGWKNKATGMYACVSGGTGNTASANCTVGGGTSVTNAAANTWTAKGTLTAP
jgi:hypothetical protein